MRKYVDEKLVGVTPYTGGLGFEVYSPVLKDAMRWDSTQYFLVQSLSQLVLRGLVVFHYVYLMMDMRFPQKTTVNVKKI